jgi:signal transduction histidine kinase
MQSVATGFLGIGLVVTKRLVELMGGAIGVNSTVGSLGASTSEGFFTHPLEAKKSR